GREGMAKRVQQQHAFWFCAVSLDCGQQHEYRAPTHCAYELHKPHEPTGGIGPPSNSLDRPYRPQFVLSFWSVFDRAQKLGANRGGASGSPTWSATRCSSCWFSLFRSLSSRAFSMAITACAAKFLTSSICLSLNGRTSWR